MSTSSPAKPHRVVIVGAGFGGLETTYRLAGAPVEITLIDRRNHHLFQPLLYQVATASLATSRDRLADPLSAARPARGDDAVRHRQRRRCQQDKRVLLEDGDSIPYDTLVLATGARHAYFGHDEWEPFAPGLKTLEDATTLRRRILVAFERAERETDPERRAALLTFVIIGAGPTGVELAGTIAELAQDTLPPDFRHIDTRKARVVLIEAGPRVLGGLSRRSLGLCASLAGKPRRRGDAGTKPSPNARPTASSMAARSSTRGPSSGPPACAPRAPPNGSARRPTAPIA